MCHGILLHPVITNKRYVQELAADSASFVNTLTGLNDAPNYILNMGKGVEHIADISELDNAYTNNATGYNDGQSHTNLAYYARYPDGNPPNPGHTYSDGQYDCGIRVANGDIDAGSVGWTLIDPQTNTYRVWGYQTAPSGDPTRAGLWRQLISSGAVPRRQFFSNGWTEHALTKRPLPYRRRNGSSLSGATSCVLTFANNDLIEDSFRTNYAGYVRLTVEDGIDIDDNLIHAGVCFAMGPDVEVSIGTDFKVTFRHGPTSLVSDVAMSGREAQVIKFRADEVNGLSLWVNGVRKDDPTEAVAVNADIVAAHLGSNYDLSSYYTAAYGGVKLATRDISDGVVVPW